MVALEPLAVAKAKQLGRDLSIKLQLAAGGTASRLQLLEWGEEYHITCWPALHLLAPTSSRCPAAFKGGLRGSACTSSERPRRSCSGCARACMHAFFILTP